MSNFDRESAAIQERSDRARERQRDETWEKQMQPKFERERLRPEQISTARALFCAAFDAGWDSHQAFLMNEFIRENQKQKVHLA
jgi:hypothetical protein